MKNFIKKKSSLNALLILLLFFAGIQNMGAAACPSWKWTNPLPLGEDLNNVIYASGQYWVVGGCGTILSSPDGVSWDKKNSGTLKDLNAIAYNERFFVAVGNNGTILKSYDGDIWNDFSLTPAPYGDFLDVEWIGDKFISAVVEIQCPFIVMSSDDGETWTTRFCDHNDDIFFAGITWTGREVIVAMGCWHHDDQGNVSDIGKILSSSNGINWETKAVMEDFWIWKTASNGSLYVATGRDCSSNLGKISVSNDLVNWQSADLPETFGDIVDVYWDGSFLYSLAHVDYDSTDQTASIIRSPDGYNWTKVGESKDISLNSLVSNNGRFAAVGNAGLIFMSDGGDTWEEVNPAPREWLGGMAFNGSLYVAVGCIEETENLTPIIVTSRDAVNWEQKKIDQYGSLGKVIWAGTQFLAAGYPGLIMSSADGIDWTVLHTGENCYLSDVIYTGEKYIAVGMGGPWKYGVIISSKDGIAWKEKRFDKLMGLYSVAFNGERIVAAGEDKSAREKLVIKVSKNGVKWNNVNIPKLSSGLGEIVRWGGDKFLLDGVEFILVSSDGLKWTQVPMPDNTKNIDSIMDIIWDGGSFCALGVNNNNFTKCQSFLLTTSDGYNWNVCPKMTSQYLTGLTYDGTKYIAVGDGGAILTSE